MTPDTALIIFLALVFVVVFAAAFWVVIEMSRPAPSPESGDWSFQPEDFD